MLAYPFPNARHGRLGNEQKRQATGQKESVGVVGWSVGEVDKVCSRSGEGKAGLGTKEALAVYGGHLKLYYRIGVSWNREIGLDGLI